MASDENVPRAFLPLLAPEEHALLVTHARVPGPRTRTLTFASIWTLIYLADTARRRRFYSKLRSDSLAKGFPLDRDIALVVTDHRLITCRWPSRMRGRPVVLGVVPLRAITSATLPFVGGAWRTVVLTVHGVEWQLLVEAPSAEGLVRLLSS